MSLIEKIEEIKNSIVAIGIKHDNNKIEILGSGFSIKNKSEILSAAHLYKIAEGKKKEKDLIVMVMIEKKDNIEKYTWLPIEKGKIDIKSDLILFKIKDIKPEYSKFLKPLELGDSDSLSVGQDIYFIGFPYATQLIKDGLGITLIVTKGIISNIKRDGVSKEHERNFIIIDAISNPGNSGCPLIDLESNKVVGVMSLSFSKKSNEVSDIREPMHICAARPINLVENVSVVKPRSSQNKNNSKI